MSSSGFSGLRDAVHYVGAKAYVLISFFQAPLKTDKAVLAPPVVRPVIRS